MQVETAALLMSVDARVCVCTLNAGRSRRGLVWSGLIPLGTAWIGVGFDAVHLAAVGYFAPFWELLSRPRDTGPGVGQWFLKKGCRHLISPALCRVR